MTSPIPVIDLAAATSPGAPATVLDLVRDATETVGVIQVVNHGIPLDLISGFDRRIERLLSLPRDRKAELASPTGHPNRGWRQWPDDFGRLELERFNVGQFDDAAHARAAGLAEETGYEPVTQWDLVKDNMENYLKVFGRPAQVAAWRDGKPYVAELAGNSAGR